MPSRPSVQTADAPREPVNQRRIFADSFVVPVKRHVSYAHAPPLANVSGFVPLRHNLYHDRAALPEQVVDAWLETTQHMVSHVVEPQHDGRTCSRPLDAPDCVEWRKPISDQEFPDLIIGRGIVYVAYPQISHGKALQSHDMQSAVKVQRCVRHALPVCPSLTSFNCSPLPPCSRHICPS